MSSDANKNRLIENELLLREANSKVKQGIKNYFQNDSEISDAPVAFVCECSLLDCDEHVNMSVKQYEKLHKRRDRFTIYPGHNTPTIEKIVLKKNEYEVVEKYALSPAPTV